jgi:hypothetical protein
MNSNNTIPINEYLLFIDECGTSNILDTSSTHFVLGCVLVNKKYYDSQFINKGKTFKNKFNINDIVLHSSDIRKTRKGFEFMLNAETRKNFLNDLTEYISDLDFKIFYYCIAKEDLKLNFDLYWFALKQNLLMIKNHLFKSDAIIDIICESRDNYQNKIISDTYLRFLKFEQESSKTKLILPQNLTFQSKDPLSKSIYGLELIDLVLYPIYNYQARRNSGESINVNLLSNYKLVKTKVAKSFGFKLYNKPK